MNKYTTRKANILLGKMSKIELSKLLQISRCTLYTRLEDDKWKDYQTDIISNVYNKIGNTENLYKICIEDEKLCLYFIDKTPVTKLIYPL